MSMSTGQSGYASRPYGAPAPPVPPAQWPPQAPHVPPVLAHPGLGRRAGAYAIDAAILAVLNAVVAVIVVGVVQSELIAMFVEQRPLALWTIPVLMIPGVIALASALALSAMQGAGGSPGQRMLGICLVHADTGARLGFWRAVWRNIVWGASCVIIVGYFTPLFDSSPRHRGWHDLASGAVMTVRGASGAAAEPAEAAPAAPSSPQEAAAPQDPPAPAVAPVAPPVSGAPADPFAGPAPIDPFAAPQQAPADPFAAPQASPADPFASQTPVGPAAPPQQASPADPFAAPQQAAPAVPPVPPMPTPPAPPAAPPEEPAAGPIAFVPGVTGERDEEPEFVTPEPVTPAPVGAPDDKPASGDEAPDVAPASAAPAPPVPAPDADLAPAAPAPTVDPEQVSSPAVDPARAAFEPEPAPAVPDFPDDTVVLNPTPAPTRVPSAVLVWDDGTRVEVTARTVFGRNPDGSDGADVVAIDDATLSLSKTHFEVAIDGSAASITDRHSTNGVVVARGGTSTTLVPGSATPIAVGDVITIGERTASVERAGKD